MFTGILEDIAGSIFREDNRSPPYISKIFSTIDPLLYPEDGCNIFLSNSGKILPNAPATLPFRQ
jgi:hypothetical protein